MARIGILAMPLLVGFIPGVEAAESAAPDVVQQFGLEEAKTPVRERAGWRKPKKILVSAGLVEALRSAAPGVDLVTTAGADAADIDAVIGSCDPRLIRRVLENILVNGIKHTPAGTSLRLALTRDDARVRVAVADEGPGVPPEHRTRIFEKFGALSSRHEAGYHSAGLGLAFCKLVVEAHGGAIGVSSGEPRGSVFWFELPG